jgi:hypothetical protein
MGQPESVAPHGGRGLRVAQVSGGKAIVAAELLTATW